MQASLNMTLTPPKKSARLLATFDTPDFVQRITSGDEGAFRELAKGMIDLLTSYLSLKYGAGKYQLNRSDAEDIAQETMCRVSRALQFGRYEVREKARFTTWIFKIADNLAASRLRQLERRKEIPLEAEGVHGRHAARANSKEERKRAAGGGVSEAVVAASTDPLKDIYVREILGKLDKKYREILVWVCFHGYSKEEIARRHGVRVNTVDQWLSRAKKQFRNAYAKL